MADLKALERFPFTSKLSFVPLINYLEGRTNDPNPLGVNVINGILDILKQYPELKEPLEDPHKAENYSDAIELMMSAVIPPALTDDILAAAFVPFSFHEFYATPAFRNIQNLHGSIDKMVSKIPPEEILTQKTVSAYLQVMEKYYGVKIPMEKPIVLETINPQTGLYKFYKVELNPRFCTVVPKGNLPKLTEEDIKQLINNLWDIDVWKSKLPPKHFEFHGFAVYRFVDITTEQILSSIKESLLDKDTITNPESFQLLQDKFQSLLNLKDTKIGLAGYHKTRGIFVNFGSKMKEKIKVEGVDTLECSMGHQEIHDKFVSNPFPILIEDLETSNQLMGMEKFLLEQGIKSVIISPLFYENEFIGVFQIGSPNKGELNALTVTKICDVVPLLSVSLKRGRDEFENSVQSIIKEQYTSIHPSVEWKFVNAAYNIITQQEAGEKIEPEEIVFRNVYPLYAASDIRNSSVERNKAIREDLKNQLKLAKSALKLVHEEKKLPILEELGFRIRKMNDKINKALLSGDELTIIGFLQKEIEPLLNMMEEDDRALKPYFEKYWNGLDAEHGILYDSRKKFERSLTTINNAISAFLDEQQKIAQKMFPHYFEKYKTDGVEYNIYIGESLTNQKKFDPIYLRNLKLWQLIATTEIARISMEMKPTLELPLDTTHLILVHSSPLSVQFRMDEKQFDVDGAYNMRYEIVKKRIDKALIKGTNERLTQPGKIAIVYSQEEDSQEYLTYIDYMQAKGYLRENLEMLEVEELQGVSGLKAIRVTVEDSGNPVVDELEKMELLEFTK